MRDPQTKVAMSIGVATNSISLLKDTNCLQMIIILTIEFKLLKWGFGVLGISKIQVWYEWGMLGFKCYDKENAVVLEAGRFNSS